MAAAQYTIESDRDHVKVIERRTREVKAYFGPRQAKVGSRVRNFDAYEGDRRHWGFFVRWTRTFLGVDVKGFLRPRWVK